MKFILVFPDFAPSGFLKTFETYAGVQNNSLQIAASAFFSAGHGFIEQLSPLQSKQVERVWGLYFSNLDKVSLFSSWLTVQIGLLTIEKLIIKNIDKIILLSMRTPPIVRKNIIKAL